MVERMKRSIVEMAETAETEFPPDTVERAQAFCRLLDIAIATISPPPDGFDRVVDELEIVQNEAWDDLGMEDDSWSELHDHSLRELRSIRRDD